MNTETGEMIPLEKLKELPKNEQLKYIQIPDDQIDKVRGMNRAERRSWARKQKRRNEK